MHLKGQRGPGKDQHGKVQKAGDYTGHFFIFRNAAHHHPGVRTFFSLLKTELKLNIRNMNMVIFAVIMPVVVLVRPCVQPCSQLVQEHNLWGR